MTDASQPLSPVKQALLTINRQQERIRALEQAAREPIAIVGLGCRFPGGADTPEAFWELLAQGREAISEVPAERWDMDAYYDPDPDAPGKMNCRHGAFCRAVDGFDAEFFNLSPRELRAMDPQQRLLLEVAWEALENANVLPGDLYGSRTGVFVGISTLDYYARQQAERDAAGIGAYYVSGGVLSVAAGRLSYLLGLNGPSLSVDTACSSSLTALHLACQNLRRKECDLALAGGVGLLLTPEPSIAFSKAHMLAPDGRCKTFDAAADGYGRGEGGGVLVLKRLSDAQADGDRILALLRGTAANQNGASGGLTVPSGPAQEAVIKLALADAGLRPEQVDYVEAHGTGTSLGDPIELRSLGQVFAGARAQPLLVGSVKTNIGHLEAAAGIAGVVKVVLALQHGAIPPHLNFAKPTPHFRWDDFPLRVPTALTPWPRNQGEERLAGVSSFGFAGSNAHVLIGAAPESTAIANVNAGPQILALSARPPEALRELALRYADHLERNPNADLAEICHNAIRYRTRFGQRLALAADNTVELAAQLRHFAAGQTAPAIPASHPAAPAAQAFLAGGEVEWQAFDATPRRKIALPTYPFQRQRYWFDQEALPATAGGGHPLLGRRLATPFLASLYQTQLREGRPAFLADHRVGGEIVVAGAHYLAMMLAALEENGDGRRLQDVQFPRALALPAGGGATLQLGIAQADDGPARIRIASQAGAADPAAPWTTHAGATLAPAITMADSEGLPALQSRCNEECSPDYVYGHAAAGGIALGPSFRPIRRLLRGQGEALGQLAGPFGPGLLDGCFQLTIAALLELPQQTLVPFNIASVHWHARPATAELWCHARIQQAEPTRLLCRLRLWDAAGTLCLSLDGFEARAADPAALAVASGEAWRDWLYRIEWHPLSPAGACPLIGPALLEQSLKQRLPQLIDRPAVDAYGQGLAALETLSAAYAREALQALGNNVGWGESANPNTAAHDPSPVAAQHRRLYTRLQQIAAETAGEPSVPAEQLAATLAQQHPAVAGELRVLQRCGTQLAAVLRGACDPLQLLFPGGDTSELAGLYADSAAARCMNTLLGETVAEALRGWPAERPIRILEIGAGTGASTAYLLQRLPMERVQYTFSDISPHFAAKARERFGAYSGIGYRTLDIEHDPQAQGFDAASFDLVVAANVLHATRDLAATLQHSRSLLAPGGLLVLLEGIAPQRWLDLIFGLTGGWWRFEDADLRPEHPLLSPSTWCELLRKTGFTEAATLSPDDGRDGPPLHQAVIVARVPVGEEQNIAPTQETAEATSPSGPLSLEGRGLGRGWNQKPAPLPPLPVPLPQGEGGPNTTASVDYSAQVLERQSLPQQDSRYAGQRWLILTDQGGCGAALAERLRAQGAECHLAGADALDAGDPVAFSRLIGELTRTEPLHHIVHLWSLDATSADDPPSPALETGCQSALHLVQALVNAGLPTPPSLSFAVAGADDAQPGGLLPGHGPLWGLGKVIALEHPELRCRRFDLGGARGDAAAGTLYRALHESNEAEVSLRGTDAFVPRLARYRPAAKGQAAVRPDGAYLITGAFGGLGLLLAEWLAQQGARHLLLLGRTAPGAEALSRLEKLEHQGVHRLIRQVDVCELPQLQAAIADMEAGGTPLRGVFHAAGVLDDGLLPSQTWPRMAQAMAPKVHGAWNLHQASAHCALDHFVLYSSAAALLGSAGQASHAAGNAFLDALALHRRAAGLPALSIAWGAWSDIGAAARVQQGEEQTLARWQRQGFATLPPRQAMQALASLMADPAAGHIGVLPIDWPRLLRDRPNDTCLAEFRHQQPAAAKETAAPSASLRERLEQAAPQQRRQLLSDHLRAQVAQILGWPNGDAVDPQRGFLELGLDSLTSMELRNRLQSALGCSLPTTLTFEHPNVAQLADYLAGLTAATSAPPLPAPSGAAAVDALAHLDELADSELDPLLIALLSEKSP